MILFRLNKTLYAAQGEMQLHIDATIKSGSFVCLYGASGVGKTSILRMLAGLMNPEHGYIEVQGRIWYDSEKKIQLPPQQRQLGLLFQDYALFPNMTVKQNLLYALKKGQDRQIIQELIEITELGSFQDRKPQTLSGGQQQRVALARALVQHPRLLLLDEPLSALDRGMRIRLQEYLLELHKRFELTTILVSHDVSEIVRLTDEVIVLESGQLVQQATPFEVFTDRSISGKFQFIGEIIQITKEDVIYVMKILIGNHLVKVVVDESEARQFAVGEQVFVASKAFNPIIRKVQ